MIQMDVGVVCPPHMMITPGPLSPCWDGEWQRFWCHRSCWRICLGADWALMAGDGFFHGDDGMTALDEFGNDNDGE